MIDFKGCSKFPISLQGLGGSLDKEVEQQLLLPLEDVADEWVTLADSNVDDGTPVFNLPVSIESADHDRINFCLWPMGSGTKVSLRCH